MSSPKNTEGMPGRGDTVPLESVDGTQELDTEKPRASGSERVALEIATPKIKQEIEDAIRILESRFSQAFVPTQEVQEELIQDTIDELQSSVVRALKEQITYMWSDEQKQLLHAGDMQALTYVQDGIRALFPTELSAIATRVHTGVISSLESIMHELRNT